MFTAPNTQNESRKQHSLKKRKTNKSIKKKRKKNQAQQNKQKHNTTQQI
jgi:hypothetical protein